jgi:hypothetical protein
MRDGKLAGRGERAGIERRSLRFGVWGLRFEV